MKRISFSALFVTIFIHASASGMAPTPNPRNIILMICDGAGFNHVDAASIFAHGESGRQSYEQFPVKLAMSTTPAAADAYDPGRFWSDREAVIGWPTDSAAAITAMTTGVKTRNGAICVTPADDPLPTICARMEDSGRATGVVTTVQFAHATPAGIAVCNPRRSNYVEIGRDMVLHSRLDVIMGAGHPLHDNSGQSARRANHEFVGGEATWAALVAGTAGHDADGDGLPDPWHLIQDRGDFQALCEGPTPGRVIGVARVRETLQQERGGDQQAAPFAVPFTPNIPNLVEMTRAALNILDDHPGGFFLMIEGGAADWASHDNETGRMIEEMLDFAAAAAAVVGWATERSNWQETLVIVTADHETGLLAGPSPAAGKRPACPFELPLENRGRGRLPGAEWYTGDHTNALVPFYARGAGSENFLSAADQQDPVFGPYLDNTELGQILIAITREPSAGDAGAAARTR